MQYNAAHGFKSVMDHAVLLILGLSSYAHKSNIIYWHAEYIELTIVTIVLKTFPF